MPLGFVKIILLSTFHFSTVTEKENTSFEKSHDYKGTFCTSFPCLQTTDINVQNVQDHVRLSQSCYIYKLVVLIKTAKMLQK